MLKFKCATTGGVVNKLDKAAAGESVPRRGNGGRGAGCVLRGSLLVLQVTDTLPNHSLMSLKRTNDTHMGRPLPVTSQLGRRKEQMTMPVTGITDGKANTQESSDCHLCTVWKHNDSFLSRCRRQVESSSRFEFAEFEHAGRCQFLGQLLNFTRPPS